MIKRIEYYSEGKKTLVMNEEIARAIELVCQYMNNEQEFEDNGGNLSKGLLILGTVGSGKTEIMRVYQWMMKSVFELPVIYSKCQQCNEAFMKNDSFRNEINGFYGVRHAISATSKAEWIFDELGSEETYVNNYGNKTAVMPHIIDKRDDISSKIGRTHYITNLSIEELLDKYGSRIDSRLHKSVNFIGLGSEEKNSIDHRKQ